MILFSRNQSGFWKIIFIVAVLIWIWTRINRPRKPPEIHSDKNDSHKVVSFFEVTESETGITNPNTKQPVDDQRSRLQATKGLIDQEQTYILVNSIGRSGSSMLGQLLSTYNPTPFYMFEPLKALLRINSNQTIIRKIIEDSILCQFNRPETLPYFRQWSFSDRTFKLQPNLRNKNFRTFRANMSDERRTALQSYCRETSFKVVKIIRLAHLSVSDEIEVLEYFLNKFNKLFVFTLIRDPRAIINSRVNHVKWETYQQSSLVSCQDLEKVFFTGQQLIERGWSDRSWIFKYEDVVTNPEQAVTSISRLLGVKTSAKTKEWVKQNMLGLAAEKRQHENKNPYSTVRNTNSILSLNQTNLSIDIGDKCSALVETMNYT